MARFGVGDAVTVSLPKGPNKRGVMGISVMYTTREEARFEGATGTVTQVNPRGPYGLPQYLVDFRGHKNRVAIPWQAQWFREDWLVRVPQAQPAAAGAGGEHASATGQGQTTTGQSS